MKKITRQQFRHFKTSALKSKKLGVGTTEMHIPCVDGRSELLLTFWDDVEGEKIDVGVEENFWDFPPKKARTKKGEEFVMPTLVEFRTDSLDKLEVFLLDNKHI